MERSGLVKNRRKYEKRTGIERERKSEKETERESG